MPFGLVRLPLDDPRSRFGLAVCVSSRAEGIGKNRQHVVIDGQLPHQAPRSREKVGKAIFSWRNHNSTWRALPSSVILLNTR